ncbi:MAG: cytochrome c biogenesis protein CcdA [Bacteroidota bacterium]
MIAAKKAVKYFLFTLLLLTGNFSFAQKQELVKIDFNYTRTDSGAVVISMKAIPEPGVKIFALKKSESDLAFSTILFDSSIFPKIKQVPTQEKAPQTQFDKDLQGILNFYTDSVIWKQKIDVRSSDSFLLKGSLICMYKKGDEFGTVEKPIRLFIHPSVLKVTDGSKLDYTSLWAIFLAAFLGGILALLTPCVYSMIPITVSFFTKRSVTKADGIKNAIYYSISIILIFTLAGFLITVLFGPGALNKLSTNWIANLVFFVIFMAFGISFLGGFEMTLPSSWSTKSDSKAGINNFGGIFFMALTLALVSFSCTGPIIGNLLVLASRGSHYGPLVGMFGFSTALALPFAGFAIFPSRLKVLNKAGGWLNSFKVTLGFLELALAMKFLSNADLSKGWRILDREIFICIWIAIFISLFLYLLGLIRFRHDNKLPQNDFGMPHLTVLRLFFALGSLTFVVYLMPGLIGAPLKGVSAFLPPIGTQDYVLLDDSKRGENTNSTSLNAGMEEPIKYADEMKIYEPPVVRSNGLVTYFDYAQALRISKKLNKPLMLDFTGINCVNCRKMENEVWSAPEVISRLKDNFVIASLYVDAFNIDLQESEQYFSKSLQKKIETLGDKNTDLQVSNFNANAQPFYFFINSEGEKLASDGYGYDPNVSKFIELLDKVKKEYNSKKN